MSNQVLNAISIGKQTVWGTPVTPTISVPVNFTGGMQVSKDTQLISSLRTQLGKYAWAVKGNSAYEGDFEMPLLEDNIGHFLLSWFGDVTTVGAGAPYVHTFSEVVNKVPYTIEQNFQDLVGRFGGAIVNSLKFSVNVGSPVTVTAGMKAKQFTETAAITPAYAPLYPFQSGLCEIYVNSVLLNGFQTCEVELLNNIEMKYTIGGDGEPQYVYTTGSEVNITFEGYLTSAIKSAVWDKFKVMEEVNFELRCFGPDGAQLLIKCPRVMFSSVETPIAEDYNKITVEGKAMFETSTAKLVEAELTNATASY